MVQFPLSLVSYYNALQVEVDNRGCVQITYGPTLVSSDFTMNSLPVFAANKNKSIPQRENAILCGGNGLFWVKLQSSFFSYYKAPYMLTITTVDKKT